MAIAAWCVVAALAADRIERIASASFPGDATDKSGLTGVVGKKGQSVPLNRFGGAGSGIDHLAGDEYLMVSDRGPADGAVDFPCRMHRIRFHVDAAARKAEVELLSTTLLRTAEGKVYSGGMATSPRLDPEGIRGGPFGKSCYISDEYGPELLEFGMDGKLRRSLKVPEKFLCPKPGRTTAEELPPRVVTGRFPNRGMEGLARTPRGLLMGMMQGALIQDGGVQPPPPGAKETAEGKPRGICCRLVLIDPDGVEPTREFAYVMDVFSHGCSEILAVDEQRFLVLERDGAAGTAAKCKRLYLIDIRHATDIGKIASLPAAGPPAGVKPVKKKRFLDLLEPRFGLAGPNCPAKLEGLTWGPDLPDGRRLLVVTVDSDYLAEKSTDLHAFAVPQAALAP